MIPVVAGGLRETSLVPEDLPPCGMFGFLFSKSYAVKIGENS
jgi:hypothetical protein